MNPTTRSSTATSAAAFSSDESLDEQLCALGRALVSISGGVGVLILVRHGQTTANASGLLLGRADPPLTEVGAAQAAAAAAWLADLGVRPVRVVSSPLQRATATAAGFGVPVEIDDRWVELDYGEYDGLPLSKVPDDIWTKWRADAEFSPPGGESFASVGRRVRAACDDLVQEAQAADVVVVSHVSPIKEAVAWALGVSGQIAWRMRLDVAAICRVGLRNGRPSLASFNETGHLRPLAVTP